MQRAKATETRINDPKGGIDRDPGSTLFVF